MRTGLGSNLHLPTPPPRQSPLVYINQSRALLFLISTFPVDVRASAVVPVVAASTTTGVDVVAVDAAIPAAVEAVDVVAVDVEVVVDAVAKQSGFLHPF